LRHNSGGGNGSDVQPSPSNAANWDHMRTNFQESPSFAVLRWWETSEV